MSFWLSFFAVLVLILAYQRCFKQSMTESNDWYSFFRSSPAAKYQPGWYYWFRRMCTALAAFLLIQLVLSISLMPLSMYGFGMISWISPVVNLLALPLVCLLIVPLLLLALLLALVSWLLSGSVSTDAVIVLLSCADLLLDYLDVALKFVYQRYGGAWYDLSVEWWQLVVALMGVIGMISARHWRQFGLSLLTFICLFIPIKAWQVNLEQWWQQQPIMRVSVFDVSQGLAVWIALPQLNILYDTGLAHIADQVIIPTFAAFRQQPNWLIVSHANADHAGGQQQIWDHYQPYIQRVIENDDCDARFNHGDYELEWFQVRAEGVLDDELPLASKDNNQSCLLKITYQQQGLLLLTGDIENKAEQALLKRHQDVQAKVLVVPHHGSKSSSSAEFIQAVNADWAIISSGYANPYGHPHPRIIDRYHQHGVEVLNTACSGAVQLQFSGAQLQPIKEYRRHQQRWWRGQCRDLTR